MPIKKPPRKIVTKISDNLTSDEKEEVKNELSQLVFKSIVKQEKLK